MNSSVNNDNIPLLTRAYTVLSTELLVTCYKFLLQSVRLQFFCKRTIKYARSK